MSDRCTTRWCGWHLLPTDEKCPDGHVQRRKLTLEQRVKRLESMAHQPFDFTDLVRRIEVLEKGGRHG